jgi:hypothetical protein
MAVSTLTEIDGLPIFEPDRSLLHNEGQFMWVVANGAHTFLRHMVTTGPPDLVLVDRLQIAEAEFSDIATLTGTIVLPHTYGLYPRDYASSHLRTDPICRRRGTSWQPKSTP